MSAFKQLEDGSLLRLGFQDLDSNNAFSVAAARDLSRICRDYKNWPGAVLVESLNSRIFCAGGHLHDYSQMKTKAQGLSANKIIVRSLNQFAEWAPPKLAFIDGDVYGGGIEWLARFDFRWSSLRSQFMFWQGRMGLSTGWQGGRWWQDRVGEPQLRQWLSTQAQVPAPTALRWGLVDRLLEKVRLQTELQAWLGKINLVHWPQLKKWSVRSEEKNFASQWWSANHRQRLREWDKR